MEREADVEELKKIINLLKDVPHAYLYMLIDALETNDSLEWTSGVIRPPLREMWPLFLTTHIIIGVVGLISTMSMLINIFCTRLHRTATGCYLTNIAINNLFIILLQLPMNFMVMLYENWVFGMVMCFVSAVVPYILVHCSLFTFIVLMVDRYRNIVHPNQHQMNIRLCLIAIWVASTATALPIVTYVHYLDIEHLNVRFRNNGLCWSTGDHYIKVVFVIVFTLPSLVLAFIVVKTSAELRTKAALCNQPQLQSSKEIDVNSLEGEDICERQRNLRWVLQEKATQYYLTIAIVLWAICWFPMKVFGIISTNAGAIAFVPEFDIIQIILLPVTIVSTITTPMCFMLMKKSLAKRDNCD